MTRTGIVVGLLALLIAPVLARNLDATEKRLIADAVTKDFKDPPAAQFRWLPVTGFDKQDFQSQTYCGMVNGKNSYGGYIGFVPFAVFLVAKNGKVIVVGPLGVGSQDSAQASIILKTCLDKGIDPRKAQ